MASDGGRLAPLTGVGFLVLMGVGFALGGDAPDLKDDSAREIVKFYADQAAARSSGWCWPGSAPCCSSSSAAICDAC